MRIGFIGGWYYIRLMLDGASPAAFDGLFGRAVEAAGRTYRNSFVTGLAVTAANIVELAACGRAWWKIENETFNVLKAGGYNLEETS